MNFVFGFSNVYDFPSMIILLTSNLLFLHFITLCVLCSLNVKEVSIFLIHFWVFSGF